MLCLAVGRTARGAKRIILAVRTGAFRSHVIKIPIDRSFQIQIRVTSFSLDCLSERSRKVTAI